MSTALAKVDPPRNGELVAANVSRGAFIVADALAQETQQRQLLGQYVAHHMTEGTDYGVIPGTKNKTLLKPGAEKLTQLFRCIPRFTIEDKVENWDTGLFHYRFRCSIVTQADDTVVAEGVGSCSTYEDKYRWRNADRACPECGKPAIKRSKYPPRDQPQAEPGWYCFGKAGGCGANFDADDAAITEQKTGRVQNPDIINCVNTVLKMAKKRALVDAAIALARCSDIFTQDLDDYADAEPARVAQAEPHPEPVEQSPPPKPAKPATGLPATGMELHRRLQDYDAKLASQKLCVRGELLAHVVHAGVKAGYTANMTEWAGPAIPFAVEVVKEFEQAARAAAAPPQPTGTPPSPNRDELALSDLRAAVEAAILKSPAPSLAAVAAKYGAAVGWEWPKAEGPRLDRLTFDQLDVLLHLLTQPAGAK